MIVYADILIIINLIVDYFLLNATASLLHRKVTFFRIVLASSEGALFSLYIFLPQSPIIIEFVLRCTVSFIMTLTAFGFRNFKEFLKASGLFFGITCLYAGLMMGLWHIFKPKGMVINNSVVYFDISATTLIICTVVFYFGFILLSKIFASNSRTAVKCEVKVYLNENITEFTAMLDTGNSLSDFFGNSEIIIVEKEVAEELLWSTDLNLNPELKSRYRIIPLNTVSGLDMLDGFRCDSAIAVLNNETVYINNPVIAISKTSFDSGYKAIINPKIFRNAVEENVSNIQKNNK